MLGGGASAAALNRDVISIGGEKIPDWICRSQGLNEIDMRLPQDTGLDVPLPRARIPPE